MTFTDKEQRTIFAVVSALAHLPWKEQNKIIGSATITELSMLYSKIKFAPYCERHGIRYEDMTDSDFEDAYREEWEA